MMTDRRSTARNRLFRIILGLLVLLWLLPAGTGQGWAMAGGDEDDSVVFNELKAGKRVSADRSYNAPEQPTVYLTFDDGPSKLTPRVLDILKQEEIPATFFVLGNQVEANPGAAERIVKEGHAIGNHSYNHVYDQLYTGFGKFWDQVQRTEKIIADTTGVTTHLVRAPGGTAGNFDPYYFYYLEQAGYDVMDWNIDSGDATRPGVKAQEIMNTVRKGPLRHELIVLMHDGTGHDESVKALPEVIRFFKDQGYAFASLTTEVKPIQFSTMRSKWNRSVTLPAFSAQLADARSFRMEWEAKEVPVTDAEPPVAVTAMEPPGPERLTIQSGESALELDKSEFLFRNGYYRVPLRTVSEAMGGKVTWDGEHRKVAVSFGMYRIEYDLARLEIRAVRPDGSQKVLSLPEMELREGTLYVPLHTVLELMGGRVLSYERLEEGMDRVVAPLHGGFGWGMNNQMG